MNKKCIIFSQSPSDIRSVLTIYNNNRLTHDVYIYVINVEGNYNYLNSLSLKAKIFFIPQIGRKRVFKFIFYLFNLLLTHKSLLNTRGAEIYFHSNTYDYITPFFIERLKNNNDIFYHDIFNKELKEYSSLAVKLLSGVVKLFLGYKPFFYKLHDFIAYGYRLDDSIQSILIEYNEKVLDKYRFALSIQKPSILIFESNDDKKYISNYEYTFTNILKLFFEKYDVYIKPHPRLGYSDFLNNIESIRILDSYIPSEMINIDLFDFVVGNISTAIASTRHKNKLCIIDMFEFKQVEQKQFYKDYITRHDAENIIFIGSLSELRLAVG